MAKNDTCPVCGQPSTIESKPFCSRGCKDRDLLQWLGEGYRIPGETVDLHADSGVDSPDNRA
ncbi:DNA gyrase inhibitor YacG [Sphingomonas sp. HITSZ_GF]|uniref:DNA gyrase inhibitor YacG n=1 Tax=Sphingomonas sp. HITSZ_GF TaxID=3037247 RepID=UPI00240E8245|nr:DNA gyrase inhibitor YacG [Sphingomonas sp. HITSZ_GF]MDG2535562.1 DNA gyrase inhibitor YacG [Sphingomonas sp. HITSZ_GF]